MEIRFDGMTAIVTGAARGQGYVCAEMLVESGAKVAMVDILGDVLTESAKVLSAKGVVKAYTMDITKISEVGATVSKVRQDLGEIDILVQAAGLGPPAPAESITEADWDKVNNINSKGLFFMMQAVTSQSMIPMNRGSIVNFASIAGIKGMRPPLCSAHYSASKGAVVQLTRQGAMEWASHNVRVNAVAPGGVKTEMTMAMVGSPEKMAQVTALVPLKRLSEPHEIASCVLFLASNAASMITGQILSIDGGTSAMGF
jgi:NAD(P)-dependent dehydrogenase (short-subunit alcohol dehydrogenase family)